jgi:hypothetical protein
MVALFQETVEDPSHCGALMADCGDDRSEACTDSSDRVAAWTEIKV